ncbi:hypothetical protein [Cryobacterium sp. Y50]|uniref:hypothetical protein n=1 Tax=Cryobacterium sp. Y50 TaxID=2048286 RepID=UPI003518C303
MKNNRTPVEPTVVTQAPEAHTALQQRVVRVLIAGQILGGIGMGATLSLGALLAAELSGSNAWSGMAATMSTLGAAIVAVPLARLAQARGRRVSLATGSLMAGAGAVLAIISVSVDIFALLLLALMLLGAGSATNLQARFAATEPATCRSWSGRRPLAPCSALTCSDRERRSVPPSGCRP